ncbi:MAG: glycosyltransferase family 39 protein [Candidatus Pacebacteria bacterium]|nr:glycosyltransferase family 39 protein [Candidatus Paceibacterota bacterium]
MLLVIINIFLSKAFIPKDDNLSYGSGDAFGIMLSAETLQNNKGESVNLISHFYRFVHNITGIDYFRIAFYVQPVISTLLLIIVFITILRNYGILEAFFSCLLIATNPWISYYSTEPSKEMFVLIFIFLAIFFLLNFANKKRNIYLFLSAIFFGLGTLFYHSIFIFLPLFLILVSSISVSEKKGVTLLFKNFLLFLGVVLLVFIPFYMNCSSSSDSATNSLTEIGKYGTFELQIRAMVSAITEYKSELGYSNLKDGLTAFVGGKHMISIYSLFIFLLFVFELRRKHFIYLLPIIFALYSFLAISLQWVSFSHYSRYPLYIIYFFYISVGLFLGKLFSFLNQKNKKRLITLLMAINIFIFNVANIKVPGYRNTYSSHIKVGGELKNNDIRIDNSNQVMFIGWPGINLSIVESYKNSLSYLHNFGWGNTDLNKITSKEYLCSNNIKYFIHDQSGSDYYNSSEQVKKTLEERFGLTPLFRIGKDKVFNEIYSINIKCE